MASKPPCLVVRRRILLCLAFIGAVGCGSNEAGSEASERGDGTGGEDEYFECGTPSTNDLARGECSWIAESLEACEGSPEVERFLTRECGSDSDCRETLAPIVAQRLEAARGHWRGFCDQLELESPPCKLATSAYLGCRRALGCGQFLVEWFDEPPQCAPERHVASESCSFF